MKKYLPNVATAERSLRFEALEPRVLFDAAPDVSVVSGDTVIIDEAGVDEEISFNVIIENVGDQDGYTPYVDFAASPDITIQQVKTNTGLDLTQGNGDPSINPIGRIAADGQLVDITTGTPVDHPMFDPTGAGLTSNDYGGAGSGTAPVLYDVITNPDLVGMYVYTAQLPEASQSPLDPGINISVIGTVDPDSVEPINSYPIFAQGGYALGQDALDNPGTVPTPVDPPLFTAGVSSETLTVTKMAPAAEYVDLNFDNPIEATNGTFAGIGNYYNGPVMHFTDVATIGGQQVDARLTVTSVTGPYQFVGTIPNHSQSSGSEPNGDLGYIYQSTGAGTGGINYRLEFFVGDGTFSDHYDMPYFGLMVYDVDGEASQSEEVRAYEADGLVGYQLANAAGSVTATREPTSVRFTGPGSNRSETDASGAFIMYFANTSTVNLDMFSVTSPSSPQPNAIFSAIDGDRSILNGDLSGFNPIVPISPIIRKTLDDPSDTEFTIGEPVEYVITVEVPEGRVGDPDAYILDAIDPGFSFVPGTLQVTLGAGITVGEAGALNEANGSFFTHTDPNLTSLPEQLRFDFDWIEYDSAANGGALSNTIEIRYQLQVENIAANQQGTTLNNRAALFYTDDDGVTLVNRSDETGEDDTVITVVEPQVDVAKTITNVTSAGPGGTVSYQITLTNPGNPTTNPLQNTGAYDITFADALPTGLQLQTGTFSALLNGVTDVSAWFLASATGVTHNPAESIDLDPGDVIVLTYDAAITGAVRNNDDLVNEVDVEWSSLDDNDANDGIDGADTGERTGDGDFDNAATGVDDYENEDTATLTPSFPLVYGFTKTVESTSATHTGTAGGTSAAITDLVIGETVTFRLTATLADGITDNVQILDTLGIANGLLDIRSVTVSAGAALSREDGNPWNNNVTISDSLGGDGYNDRVQVDFGNVINNGTGSGSAEQIVVLVEAVVVNDLANQEGDVITNTGTLNYEVDTTGDGNPDAQTLSATADVEIVEPSVTVTKTIPTPPANPQTGDTVGYQIILENTSAFDAFDLTFRDLLPAQLQLQTGSFTAVRQSDSANVAAFFTPALTGINEATAFDLAAGDRITITYDAVVTGLVTDGQELVNNADVEWTSIDGASADERGGDGDFDNPAVGVDDYEDGDTATLTADLTYGFTKTITATSASHTGTSGGGDPAMTDLVVGESVTYLLTAQLGRGSTPSVIIDDILSLANGILDIRSVTIEGGAAISLQSGNPVNSITPVISDSNGDFYQDRLTLNFGGVNNNPALSSGPADEQIRVYVEAVVVNIVANQGGDVINNLGRLTVLEDTDGDGNADDTVTYEDNVDVEIVEPVVTVTKATTSVPANPQAGDTVAYQVVIENSSAFDAFDLSFRDLLPGDLALQTGTFTAIRQSDTSDVSAFFSVTTTQISHAASFDLAAGDRITLTYSATLLETVRDGETLTNEADIEWTSIDGANADERGGDGDFDHPADPADPDDYEDEDNASFQANLSPAYAFTKEVASTSESHTGTTAGTNAAITDLVVGETVVYRLTATLGRGTTDNVQIFDTLDIANGRLDIRSVTVSAGAALTRQDGNPWDNDVTISDALGGGDGYDDSVQIDFGTVVNDASGTGAAEQIVILIEAVVVNDLENQGGDVINNEGELRFLEDTDQNGVQETRSITDDVDVEIVEPAVDVTKTVTSAPANPNAGDTIIYQVVIENTSAVDAFDLTFRDLLPAQLELQTGTFTATRQSDGFVVNPFFSVGTGSVTQAGAGFDLVAGDRITISYSTTVLPTVTDGLVLTNEADVEWTSINGVNADERGGDGDYDNPAGLGNPDDYESEDEASVTANLSPQYAITKEIFSTSATHTGVADGNNPAITDLTIGETVTYVLTATIAEGTTPSVLIDDVLALANGVLDIRSVTITGGSNLSTSAAASIGAVVPAISDSNLDGYNDQVSLDFGQVVNDASGTDPEDGQIRIEIEAVVVNVLANQDGDVINNLGRLTVLEDTDGDGNADDSVSYEDDVDVEIVEPSVTVAKSITSVPANPDAGDTVSYQVVITNTGDIDAFDLTFSDVLPTELDLVTGSFTAQRSDLTNVASFFTVTTDSVVHTGAGFDLAAGQSITLTYNATILETVRDGQSLTNEVDIEWTSIDGANADERGGDGDPDNTATGVDDYEDEDEATIQANLSPLYAFTKEVTSTSESHTGSAAGTNATITDLVVGETVVYRLTATLGRGTTDNVQIFDVLDIANGRLDIRSVTVSAGAALTRQDGNPWDNDVTISDALGGGDGYNDSVQIDFGTVVNNASGTGTDEQIVILIEAVVVNDLENQGGDVINNEGELRFLEDTDQNGVQETRSITDDVDVEIVEPAVTVTKSIPLGTSTADAGDVVGYRIVIENTSDVDAFDLTFRDLLPGELEILTGSFTAQRSDLVNVASLFDVTTAQITHAGAGFDLAAGQSITINYNATVLATVTDGLNLINEADVEWTSTDGVNADERGGDGDFDNPAVGVDDYESEDDAAITADIAPLYDFTKSILSTSESHTGTAFGTSPTLTDLVIGETVTYRLVAQMGRGTTPSVIIEDILSLTNGILDIRDVRISAGAAISLQSGAAIGTIVPVTSDSNADTYTDQVTINFGAVINNPALSSGVTDEQIVIEIDAVVVNVLANQDGDVINNLGRLTVLEDTDGDGNADDSVSYEDDVDVEIVEPSVSVAKTVTSVPADPDAGDTVSYQIVITNTGDIDAFDVTFSDILPAELDIATGSFTAQRSDLTNVASFFAVTTDSIVHAGTGFDLAAGQSITLTYDATILETVRDGQNLTNEVDVEWTSTDGVNPDERGGDGDLDNPAGPGNPNNYEDEDSQTVQANLLPVYAFTKTIVSTSESHTGTADGTSATVADLVVGETVTYQLTATLGRGTTDNVQIFDILDIANGRLDIRNVTVSAGAALTRQDGNPWDNNVTISDALGADGYNDSVQIDFGTVINDASGTGSDEQIIVTITAMVVNDLENQDGDVINNEGELRFLEDTDQDGTQESRSIFDDVDVEIVEPDVSVTKTITGLPANPDAGDTVTYRIVIENTSDIDAFDITFRDLLPDELDLEAGSFTAIRQSGLNNVASWFSVTADEITHAGTGFDLAAGDSIVITYDATILATVRDGQDLANEADIEWTSTDGVNADERGGDGDFDNPAAGVNDYEDESGTTFRADLDPVYDFTKEIVATSATHTGIANGTDPAITDLTIGETVTYRLTATLGRGTTDNVQIFDILDIANGRLDIRNVTVSAGAALSRADTNDWDADVTISDSQGGDGYNDTVQIDFNTVVNDPALSGDPKDEQIVIIIEAVVVNDAQNQDGDVINNVGEFRFLQDTDEDGVQEQQVLSDDVDVEIVEPEISVTKSVVTAPADPNAGDTVSYRVVIENTGEIDAFEVDFRDALPAELDIQTGTFTAIRQSDGLSVATWFNVTTDSITNGFQFDLAVGDRVTITYDAVILPTVTDGLRLVNEADAEWTSINGANGDERTGDGDFDNPANGANDYESGEDATVIANLSPQYDFIKEILSTSAAHTGTAAGTDPGITDLVVGETVTYVLTATLGEGTTNQVFLSDRLNTSQASFEITGVRITGGSNLTTTAAASFNAVTVNYADDDTNGFNDRFFIDFRSVVNDATGTDPEDGQIRIEVDARVLNVLGNDEGDVVNNVGVFQYTEDLNDDGVAEDPEFSELTDDVDVEIVEPAVTVTKSIPAGTTEADAGDTIGYRIVIENPSETDAFDLTFRDLLPAQMDVITASFTAIRDSDGADVSAFFTVTADDITHAGTGFDLAAGDFITIDYDATVLATVTDGASLINEVDIEWTSLDGDDPNERGGDGDFDTPADPTDPNHYEDEDEAEITGELSPLYDFSKSVFATSESHTGSAFGTDPAIADLVIGETVTYELVAQLGRGTTPSVVIEDFLALTNGILDIRDVRIEIGSAVTVTSSTPVISDSNADTYDDQVLIDFGSVVNDPTLSNGPTDEQIRVYIDAVVVNILANQDGDVINNLGRLTVLEDTDGDGDADDPVVREDNVDVEIVEPTLDVAKRITAQPLNPDGADTVSYEVVITNTGDIDAFEVTFLDDLPTKVALDTGSFTAIRDSDGADVSVFFALAADSVAHSGAGFTLEAGDFITLTYDVTILETIKDGDRQTNLVDIEWTSTDGVNTDERGGDGDYDNPADPGDPNNYEDEDQTTFIANLVGYDFEKTVFTTSLAHTGDGQHDPAVTDLTIGETVTYALTATFPEGTTPSVSIIDLLDLSEGILDIESVSISAGVNLSSDQGAINGLTPLLEDTNGDGFTDKMTLVFGEITNDASDSLDPAADQLVIYVTARVVNIIENRDGDLICNSGTFTYQEDINDDGTIDIADPATNIEDCADVELVEPDLTIDKSVNNDKPKLAETLTYTLTVTNDATTGSADGFDLEILDRLPVGLTLDPASVVLTHVGAPANPSNLVANTSDGQNLRLQLDRLDLGEQIIITYEATVTSDISYYMAVLPNEADLEWTSTPGDTPEERGGDGDPDTDADPTLTPDFYDDNDVESVEVHQPDLKIVKRDGGVQIRPGQTVTYTMEVTNQGRATALDVTITDNINHYLAEGFQFVGASDGGRLNGAGVVTWNLPDLAVDESMTISLTLLAPRVVPAGVEVIHNIAVADHLDIEPSPDDNRDREDTPITAFPDLVVKKDDGLTHATVGDLVTYRISFDNVGNQVASGVVIRDTLPPGVKFVSASDGGRLRGNTVVWELGELRPGDGDTFTVVVEILTDGEKLNIVTIEDDGRGGPDPTPKNNRDTDITIGKKGFQFDLNQNFLFSNGNQNVIGGSFRSELMRLYPEFDFLQDSRIPVVLGTHMNSGLAQPGSTITLEVYNDRGERIAEQSVIADTGGNWLATFVTDKIDQQPARIVMKQTWSTPNVGDDTGYNFRTYFAPTFSTASYYSEELSIWNVTGKRAATEVLDLYEASKNILHLDWNGTTYEFNSRGGLQSASGN